MAKKLKLDKPTGIRGRCFLLYARKQPSAKDPEPKVLCCRVYAPNAVIARSRFWTTALRKYKLRKSGGELLRIQEVFESKKTQARNFGIFLKYRSTVGVHNMFKEYRDTSVNGAIDQMYNEMGGNHRVSSERITILTAGEIGRDSLRERKPRALIWADTQNLKYPLWKRNARPSHPKYFSLYHTRRPCVMKTGKSITK